MDNAPLARTAAAWRNITNTGQAHTCEGVFIKRKGHDLDAEGILVCIHCGGEL